MNESNRLASTTHFDHSMLSRRRLITTGLSMVAGLAASGALAQERAWYTPKRGTAERKDILDAIRPAIEAEMRGPVEFVILDMRVQGDWAVVVADPQRPGGAPIDVGDTGHAEDMDFLDGLVVYAICLFAGDRWNLIDHVTGPTDVAYSHWPQLYGVPAEMLGL